MSLAASSKQLPHQDNAIPLRPELYIEQTNDLRFQSCWNEI